MNVRKFGPTCVTLYSFDMLSNRTTGKIRYEDVEIKSNPLESIPGFMGTEKG